jgi:alkylhydroperoxidase family enzyme
MSPAQMAELKDGKVPQGLPAEEQALCAYTFAFTACGGLSDDVLDAARRHFSDKQIVDASLLSAYFMGGGAVITAFAPELDPPDSMRAEREWQTGRPHR